MPRKSLLRLSLGTQVVLALILGLAVGVFLGEKAAFLKDIGRAFILLLQMTVLPYITLSLITGLGQLTYQEVKELILKAGAVLLCSWALAVAAILVIPLAFPVWESASFFSTSLVEPPETINYLQLFIPSNPFSAYANNVVPAVVIFSIAVGVALIGIEQKQDILGPLRVLNRAMGRVTQFVSKLTPLGPSTGIFSPGLTTTTSPGATVSTATSSSWPSRTTRAVLGRRPMRRRIASDVWPLARASR